MLMLGNKVDNIKQVWCFILIFYCSVLQPLSLSDLPEMDQNVLKISGKTMFTHCTAVLKVT